jgi:hypothetical protein
MGKARQQSSMLQCFALAIWWSYYELPVMKTAEIALKTQTLGAAINVVNGQ